MIHRRTFLKQSGLAIAATTLLPGNIFASTVKQKVGLQLYSMRESLPQDVKGTLEKIAKVGFKEVETYGYSKENAFWGTSLKEFKKILDDNGLATPSGHYGMDPYLKENGAKDELMMAIDAANTLEQKYVIIPYLSEGLRNNYGRLADKLNEAGEVCKKAGLKLAYHNHDFEFDKFDGETAYEIMLRNTEKDLVSFEMDIYWVVRAGTDPVALIEKYPGRFPLWHVKDMSKTNPELNTEIGNGSIDYNKIFDYQKKSGAKHLILEQENFEIEPYKSLDESYNYIQQELLG
ncbi:sugar phosphate isomerase/epimerase [Zunongwangia sp. F363]|uniref:Sugar phosphate isomerase/epimerase n=1 Tax=Autumnicola tepida TaxID=3075595 RepID=A0ABU3C7F4_9FLAO|nr:sugar phosphate isomerase/epimerase [Zunongwangia sp. F363]MDT0642241.1 sugar phosphate isomerase/epimerase [Zunongwangia sp. F363]